MCHVPGFLKASAEIKHKYVMLQRVISVIESNTIKNKPKSFWLSACIEIYSYGTLMTSNFKSH